jgi:DNA-binding CsgD family transcriptional regulator
VIIDEETYLQHYGILRKSGRYPWGSGGTQNQRNKGFLDYVAKLHSEGMSEVEIARGLSTPEHPISVTTLRAIKSIARTGQKQADINRATMLKNKGLSNVAIGKKMGINESSVRSLLQPSQKQRADVLQSIASKLKDQVDKKGYIDVGAGVENHLGISATKLKTAIAMLKEEGYDTHYVKVEQLGTGKQTTMIVLAAPKTTYSEVYRNRSNIKQITDYSEDDGGSWKTIKPPKSISSKRVDIKYAEDGGADADGVIYIRPGVKDVSIGASRYAQVRVAVDGSHYLKGMAMYKDDLPEGVDIQFNTNKHNTGNKLDAMKKMSNDPDSPFGSQIRRQILNKAGTKPTSAMNMVYEEGNWAGWTKSLSSQMLSKQSPKLAQTQLGMTHEEKQHDLDEIMALTNPTVRKHLLEKYADGVDAAAVHLKAKALPRVASHVILPINSMKENEVYAPNYRNGERVVLIRHPHAGTFEIPELVVNNNHPEAKKLLGRAPDAIGIHKKVAERLSGADFDGDTVLVIPNNQGKVKTSAALHDLKNFDPQREYPGYEGMPKMTPHAKQVQMGVVSNLITDMTLQGAGTADLARAVRHSMVVIDAEKHNLNYKLSAQNNGIAQLKEKYQGSSRAGASTLISRAKSQIRVPDQKPRTAAKGGPVDRETGRLMFEPTGRMITDKNGKTRPETFKSRQLAETHDARTLLSKDGGTKMEQVYATHSNNLKALANKARLAALHSEPTPMSPSAKKHYAEEVKTLDAKLNIALKNRPLERQAQLVGNTIMAAKRQANPDMEPAEIKKLRAQALNEARARTGAGKELIHITDKEWDAIQAGAVSTSKLTQILNNTDLDHIKELATPRTNTVMSPIKERRAAAMLAQGYTQSEVADALGVALSTLTSSLKRKEEG